MFDWSPVWTFAGVIVVGLFGTGGIVAWRRLQHDKKIGVQTTEIAEDDAEAKRWQSIIETQTKVLLEPMQRRLGELETTVAELQASLDRRNRQYWAAISYIRTLLMWIHRFMPDELEQTAPQPPVTINEDV